MNLLDLIPGEYRRAGGKNGGEYHGSCPWCGDGGKGRGSDRFHIWPEQGRHGTYWCRQCGRGGDAIKFLIDFENLDFKQALDKLGMHPAELGIKDKKVPTGWQPSAASRPTDAWADHAKKFALWCHDRLLERSAELDWLESRGIDLDLVLKYRLGYNPTHAWRERPAWGLKHERKPDTGKLKKLWLPRGLVIPWFSDFSENAQVLRLRVRQPDQLPRYFVIPGSSREPMISQAAEGMVVVESELDAILLDGAVGDLVGVVAMGNDTAKPTADLMPAFNEALTILVALDSDLPKYNSETGRMDIPGAKASRWWLSQFPQALRLPVIGGKDPGEAHAAGVDLHSWVMAALPPYFQVKADLQAEKTKRLAERKAARLQTAQEDTTIGPLVNQITLKNGKTFAVTGDLKQWKKLSEAGELVFSDYELKRLKTACMRMNKEDRLAAAMLVLEVKEVFAPARIRRGEVIAHEKN